MPPFLACGAPIKSSILLAPLIPVGGLEGAEGGPEGGPETDRMGCWAPSGANASVAEGSRAGDPVRDGTLEAGFDMGGFENEVGGVATAAGSGGTGGVEVDDGGGAAAALTALEGPFGGGGGGAAAGVASGFFLSTHRFFSES